MDLKHGLALAWISFFFVAFGDSLPDSYQFINFGGKGSELMGKSPLAPKEIPTKAVENRFTADEKLTANPVPALKATPDVTATLEKSQSQRKKSGSYPRTDPATSSYGR